MEKQNEKIALPVIGIVLGALALLLSWIPIVNNLAFGLALIGLVITGISFFTNKKNVKTLTIISLALSLIAGGIVLAVQASFSNAIENATSSSKDKKKDEKKSVSKVTDGSKIKLSDVTIKVTNHKVIPVGQEGNEYGKKPVIAFWYEVTNNSDKDIDPNLAWILNTEVYQDTDKNQENKLSVGALPDKTFLKSQTGKIKQGGTVKNATAYELDSETVPVDIVVKEGYGDDVLAKESISIK